MHQKIKTPIPFPPPRRRCGTLFEPSGFGFTDILLLVMALTPSVVGLVSLLFGERTK